MKRLLCGFILSSICLFGQAACPTGTPITSTLGLQEPLHGSLNWDYCFNHNWDLIDKLLSGGQPVPALSSTGSINAASLTASGAVAGSSISASSAAIGTGFAVAQSGTTKVQGLDTGMRLVSTTSDIATVDDHTLVMSGVTTEALPSSPNIGQELHLVASGSNVTITGGGQQIWIGGAMVTSIVVLANQSALLQYDGIQWRVIK